MNVRRTLHVGYKLFRLSRRLDQWERGSLRTMVLIAT